MITNPKTFFEQFQNFIEESGLQLKKFKSNLSNYFTKAEAIDTFLGKTDQAESAKTADTATKATQDSEGNVISSTYLKTSNASTTYLTQANASSTYLTKTGKATSASTADTAGSANTATKATQDASGNVITATYATKTELANKLDTSSAFTKAQADTLYLGKSAKATSASTADSATSATKATQDASGNTITSTYATKTEVTQGLAGKANASHTHTPAQVTGLDTALAGKASNADLSSLTAEVTKDLQAVNTALEGKANSSHTHTIDNVTGLQDALDATSTQASNAIPKSGNRGAIAGYESSTSGIIVSDTSADSLTSSRAIEVKQGTSGTTWTKVMYMTSGSVSLGANWKWSGGRAPTLKFPGVLVCHWNNTGGIASYTAGAS